MTDLKEALKRANERYDAMTPDEQAAMWKAQRESWVRAFTTPCEHGHLDWETCPHCRSRALGNEEERG